MEDRCVAKLAQEFWLDSMTSSPKSFDPHLHLQMAQRIASNPDWIPLERITRRVVRMMRNPEFRRDDRIQDAAIEVLSAIPPEHVAPELLSSVKAGDVEATHFVVEVIKRLEIIQLYLKDNEDLLQSLQDGFDPQSVDEESFESNKHAIEFF